MNTQVVGRYRYSPGRETCEFLSPIAPDSCAVLGGFSGLIGVLVTSRRWGVGYGYDFSTTLGGMPVGLVMQ